MGKTTTATYKPDVNAVGNPAAHTADQVAPVKPAAKTSGKRAKAIAVQSVVSAEKSTATSSVKTMVSSIDARTNQFIESGETIMNDQVQQFTELQASTFEPVRSFSALAVEAVEQVVRKNYEVIGEIVDFSVKQVQLPSQNEDVSDVVQAKIAEATAFTELLGNRANEYVDLGNQFNLKVRDVAVASVKAA